MFGENFRKLRISQNLTYKEMADILSVNAKTIKKWESGQTKPNLNYLVKIAKFFNVKLNDLVGL